MSEQKSGVNNETTDKASKAFRRIGITGGIGSGKSAVTDILRGKGYTVIDADEAAREAALPGELPMQQLREEIGDGVFLEDGNLDRPTLAKLAFGDPMVLSTVNEIFHSDIKKRIEARAKACGESGEDMVFISAPLLLEADMGHTVDEVWLVTADEDVRMKRTIERDGLSEEDVRTRMRSQMPEGEKRSLADRIIENNGTLMQLRGAVESMLSNMG